MSLADTITLGLNNPDCAFYVGQSLGYSQAGTLIFRIAIIYFGFKLIDKYIFEKIPIWIKKLKDSNNVECTKSEEKE